MTKATDQEVLVSTNNVSRHFQRGGKTVEALQPTTVEVYANTRTALMGSSGSGKSTLLHLFAGIDWPSRGSIGWPALGTRETLRPGKIAIAFQAPSLVPFLSVAENVCVPLFALNKGDRARDLAMAELERMGLEALAETLPEELSGGQAQRIGLARATASRPRLLLADEPTAQLDLAAAEATIGDLISWAEGTGCTLLVATHDAQVARRFDEVWEMDHGRLIRPAATAQ